MKGRIMANSHFYLEQVKFCHSCSINDLNHKSLIQIIVDLFSINNFRQTLLNMTLLQITEQDTVTTYSSVLQTDRPTDGTN